VRVAILLVVAIAACGTAIHSAGAQSLTNRGGTLTSPLGTNPFLGSVPTGTRTTEAIRLTVGEAIGRALQHNLGLLMAEHGSERADGLRRQALSDLLPNVNGSVIERRQIVNLAAFGFPLPPGIPPIVGPFNVFDARIALEQRVYDRRAINDWKAEQHNQAAAELSYKSARDIVVLASVNAYLQALATAARAESVQAQLRTAEALSAQASDLKTAGLVAGIDVLRAQLQASTQRQRSTAALNDAEKAKLQLARVIGLPTGQAFTLVDELPPIADPDVSLESAVEQALKNRPDYQAALERVRAAEATRESATSELLPSVHVNADYGVIGLTPSSSERTYTLAGAVKVPIFQGGRQRGRLLEADAALRSRRAEADDMRNAIYYEVQSELLDLRATGEQLKVATQARELAAEQLAQARDRLAAGVTDTIEVVQAQEAVSLASEQYIGALYGFNIAKALLARGLGIAEAAARQFIGDLR
jgi:outer membrane protein TolC